MRHHYTDDNGYYRVMTNCTINHKNEIVTVDISLMKKISKHVFVAERNKWFRDNKYEWKYNNEWYTTNDKPIVFDSLEKNNKASNFKLYLSPQRAAALIVHNGVVYVAYPEMNGREPKARLYNQVGEFVKFTSLTNCKNFNKIR